jgi:hypothetical protein
MHKKLIAGVVLLIVNFLVIPVYRVQGNETSTYRFDLVKGKNTDVCRHMHKVYNRYFQQLFDIEKAKPELWNLFTKTYRDIGALNSFYPTSPEFDAVKWDIREYVSPNVNPPPERIALLTEIDIDNDGAKETVAKRTFYDMGSHYSERLLILSDFKLSESGQIQYDDFYRKRPVSLADAAIIRPFIYKGTTYLHWYEFKLPKGDSTPDPTVYDKWILIRKYLGTRLNKEGYNEPQYRDLCEFNVIDVEAERYLRNIQKKKGE